MVLNAWEKYSRVGKVYFLIWFYSNTNANGMTNNMESVPFYHFKGKCTLMGM